MTKRCPILSRKSFWAVPLGLALLAALSYGGVLNKLGLYWDDWAYLWTHSELGYAGILRHFSFSRPLAGQIQNLVMSLTGNHILIIQIYGLLMRVLAASLVALLELRVWQGRKLTAAMVGVVFMVYPGFTMQPIALNFGFSYLLISLLCISFLFTIRTVRGTKKPLVLLIPALALSAVNLFASEYFFLLELLRPLLIAVAQNQETPKSAGKFRRMLRVELPYLCLFSAGVIYRAFFNRTQTLHYEFNLVRDFRIAPLRTILNYLGAIAKDSFAVLFSAWGRIFQFPQAEIVGRQTVRAYWIISLLALVLCAALFILYRQTQLKTETRAGVQMILIGLFGVLLAGQPFWLTESYLSFVFPNSRYTLPFLLGMSLFWGGVFSLLSQTVKTRWFAILTCALAAGLATGSLFISANEYRRDWTLTKDFFHQLKWRIPAMAENTVVVTNALPIRFSTDNSLTAPLNWIYASGYAEQCMPYMLYTNTKREETLSKFAPGQKITQEYLSAVFEGTTDDVISVYYQAPGCVHVLDPAVDLFNQTIPIIDREAAQLNNFSRIRTDVPYQPLDDALFGAEPARGWCWYYEHADLARQKRDWEAVAALGDEAFALQDHPNDPLERLPFIEGYAYTADWQRALALTRETLAVTPVTNNPLCALWNRIGAETAASDEKAQSLTAIDDLLDCAFLK